MNYTLLLLILFVSLACHACLAQICPLGTPPENMRGPPPPLPRATKVEKKHAPHRILQSPHAIPTERTYLVDSEGLHLQIASDLHLEFYQGKADKNHLLEIVNPVAPVLALLGDIGLPDDPLYEEFLLLQAERFQLVLVILGNHEFYQEYARRLGLKVADYEEVKEKTRKICDKHKNLIFMDKLAISIGGIRVIGATLWTAIPAHAAGSAGAINDYNYIYKRTDQGLEKITWQDTREWHDQELAFVLWQVEESMKNNEKDCVVLTHHAPQMTGTSSPEFEGPFQNRMNFAFGTSLEYSFRDYGKKGNSNIHTWCYGHTHFTTSVNSFGTLIVSNQRGYPGAKTTYKSDFSISVKK